MTASEILFFMITQFLMSCSLTPNMTPMIRIKMVGIEAAPAGAFGNASPISQTYELKKVILETEEEEMELPLDAPLQIRIGHQPLIIYETEIPSEVAEKTFLACRVVFSTEVTGLSRYNSSSSVTLPSSDVRYATSFTVAKGQDLTFLVQANWKSTVLRDEEAGTDVMFAPNLVLQLD
jgi:hypothetical protein